jgi:alpha-1,2-mannosyltransferase
MRTPRQVRVAFLHPECLYGGGGERVLWVAVRAVRVAIPSAEIAICAPWPSDTAADTLLASTREKVASQFNMDVPEFTPIHIRFAWLTSPLNYPRLTLLFQSLAMVALGLEAYFACAADVFIDTANQTFALIPAKILGATTVSYIHYPTISTNMLTTVRNRTSQFNNNEAIARSSLLSGFKLMYYRAFAGLYALAGHASDITMVNSTWTSNHVHEVWGVPKTDDELAMNSNSQLRARTWPRGITTVFPPCDTSLFSSLPIDHKDRVPNLIVSVGQFRPEKNHMLQLEVMRRLRTQYAVDVGNVRLIMIGGARNAADRDRVSALRRARAEMGLESTVTIRENAPWSELLDTLRIAWAGLHTMRDEHFGISVVELQASGVIAVGHRSGGVAADIIEDGVTGFLAGDADEYARKLRKAIVEIRGDQAQTFRIAARKSAARFADDKFGEQFAGALAHAVHMATGSSKER